MNIPLAERMRPRKAEQLAGQSHLVGKDGSLGQILERGLLPSFILWGPPGVGKTTLAEIVARQTKRTFFTLSAVSAGVKEVRQVIDKAREQSLFASSKTPVLFIDEIHRFSKSQQDSLLAAVEKGWICLIGATTENPSFELNSALLSRCQVYVLKPLQVADLRAILARAYREDRWLQQRNISIAEDEVLLRYSGGDARKLLNNLEVVVSQLPENTRITNALTEKLLQKHLLQHDKSGENHYDVISAFIKSIRGSDPNAGIYWLARLIEGGEEPSFIARRLLILAAEDVGLANPNALLLANSTFDAVLKIGWPESQIILAQCVVYLALSAKSNSAYAAINASQKEVRESGSLAVPLHLRNAPTQLMKELGYSESYAYAHDFSQHFVDQDYMPEGLQKQVFYRPSDNTTEEKYRERLQAQWPKYEY